jgi:hypothetical protein
MQEVLVLIVIALAIFYLPRVLGRRPAPEPEIRLPVLTGWMRLAILVTVLWVAGFALFLKPWDGDTLIFLSAGLGPVAVLWGGLWVWSGYRKYRQ